MPAISRTWVLIAIGLLQLPLCGQQNVGSIKGTVRDPSGAIMPGVSAVVRDQATGVETKTTTNETGAYEFLGLGIGEYTLTVSAPGFKTTETPDIRLVAGSILTFDLKLTLGAVTERVTVSARAAPLDTSSTTMGTTVTSEQLRNLPLQLAGQPRSSLNFLATLSTVNYNPSGGLAAINSANLEGSSAYGQNNYAGYSIDGMNASSIQFVPNDQAPLLPDAVAEVRLASNFNAEQGWNNGVQIEVVSKSGTN